MDVRDYEGTAVPARRKPEPPIPASYAKDVEDSPVQEGSEVATTENAEISADEMADEPLGSEVCCIELSSSVETGAPVVATRAQECHFMIS